MTDISIIKTFLYLTIISGVVGPAFFAVNIGPLSLFPYRILVPLVWALILLRLSTTPGGSRFSLYPIMIKPYTQFLMLWLLYAVLSIAWASSTVDAIRHIIFLFMGVSIISQVIFCLSNLRDLNRFFNLWLLILIPLIALGFWNHFTGNHLSTAVLAEAEARFKSAPTGVFRNQNDYATYLALSVPFVLTFIRYKAGIAGRVLGIPMLLTSLYLIVAAFSRANYLAVLIGIVFWLIFLLKVHGKIKALVLTGWVVLLLSVFCFDTMQCTFRTLDDQVRTLSTEENDGSLDTRVNLIKNSFTFLGNSFGLGIGAGNAEYYMKNFSIYNTHGVINVHNWWLEILLNYGIFVFGGYFLFFILLFIRLYNIYPYLKAASERMICEAILVSLVVFAFASISSSSIMTLGPQWIIFAFALGFLNYYRINRFFLTPIKIEAP